MSPASSRRLLRASAATAAASLAAFHVALLVRRLAQPEAVDAIAALRWAGALALLAAYALSRRGSGSRLRRRQLVALGLVALSLHAPALQGPAESARTALFWTALPNVLGAALSLFGLLALDRSGAIPLAVRARRVGPPALAGPASPRRLPLSTRPPPFSAPV